MSKVAYPLKTLATKTSTTISNLLNKVASQPNSVLKIISSEETDNFLNLRVKSLEVQIESQAQRFKAMEALSETFSDAIKEMQETTHKLCAKIDQNEEAAKIAELDEMKQAINSLTNICYQIKIK